MDNQISQAKEMPEKGDLAPRSGVRATVIAAAVCLLLALLLWLIVMNGEGTAYVKLKVGPAPEGAEYTLSEEGVTVCGKRAALRRMEALNVIVPNATTASGVYTLDETDLDLPEGVTLREPISLTLTVSAHE